MKTTLSSTLLFLVLSVERETDQTVYENGIVRPFGHSTSDHNTEIVCQFRDEVLLM